MAIKIFILSVILTFTSLAQAIDQGFRYDAVTGKCWNAQKEEGLNSFGELIECADFRRSGLRVVQALKNARILGVNVTREIPANCAGMCETFYQDFLFFANADARGFVAEKSGFINVDFSSANLEKAKFSDSIFIGRGKKRSTFASANLRQADFRRARLHNVIFEKADLRGADFRGADLETSVFTGAIFDQHTQWPFSQSTATDQGMIFQETPPEGLPLDQNALLPPPALPTIADERVFQAAVACTSSADCEQKLGADLVVRRPLTLMGENEWRLVAKDDGGSWWQNPFLDFTIWRSSATVKKTIAQGIQYCRDHQAVLPEIDDFTSLAENGYRSLFPEVQKSSYWSATSRDSGTGAYYFFDGQTGTTGFSFDDQLGVITCRAPSH